MISDKFTISVEVLYEFVVKDLQWHFVTKITQVTQ